MFRSDPAIFHSRVLLDGKIEFIYFDGTRAVRNQEEVKAEQKRRNEKARADFEKTKEEFFGEDGLSQLRQDFASSISITQVPADLGYEDEDTQSFYGPNEEGEHLGASDEQLDEIDTCREERLETDSQLVELARALDCLDLYGVDSKAAELANHYVTLHGMGYPLFEIYKMAPGSEREGEKTGEVILGYRMDAAAALIFSNTRFYGRAPEDEYLWESSEGLWELRRLLYIVTDRDEAWDSYGIMSETTRWPESVHVNNGLIVRQGPQRLAWERALDSNYKNDGHLYEASQSNTMPLMLCSPFGSYASFSVIAWMQRGGGRTSYLSRQDRWRVLCDIVEKHYYTWIFLDTEYKDADEKQLLVCLDGGSLDYQIVQYWLQNQDLKIPQKRYGGSAQSEWEYGLQDPLRSWWQDPDLDDELEDEDTLDI